MVQYENLDDGTGIKHLLEGNMIYGTVPMPDSSFQVKPFLDSTLIQFSSSEIIYTSHIDPNTGATITDLQVGLINTVQLVIKDIYGNEFSQGNNVTFIFRMTPQGGASLNYTSIFNTNTLRYEFYVIPVKSGVTLVEIFEISTAQQLSGSPVNKTVIAGKYDPGKFILSQGSGSCYI